MIVKYETACVRPSIYFMFFVTKVDTSKNTIKKKDHVIKKMLIDMYFVYKCFILYWSDYIC